MSSIFDWFRASHARRGVALAAVVLATGGLALHRASPAGAGGSSVFSTTSHNRADFLLPGKSSASFAGPGLRGMLSLSHSKVLADTNTNLFAELKLMADEVKDRGSIRAPIALAVVLDTSGSMDGEKMEEAKRSVLRLLDNMRDDDEITIVRYASTSEVIQPLARVGSVRGSLARTVRGLHPGGGTNIPSGLERGLGALEDAAQGRVRRVVLVSDGLDSTRAEAERLARRAFSSGVTISSLGIGLDFDEGYMGSVAESGHGNFAFVKDGASLAGFLQRELVETANTTIENARVRVTLPDDVRFVSATGADVVVDGGELEINVGSLFAGDQRRVVLELVARVPAEGERFEIATRATWALVGGGGERAALPSLYLAATSSEAAVKEGRDGAVLASAASVVASRRQLEANEAYAKGDIGRATSLVADNERALGEARAAAPAAAGAAIEAQLGAYREQREGFAKHAPSSEEARAAVKASAAQDRRNFGRGAY